MENMTFKYQCPFCKVKSEYTPQELSEHFLQIHSHISPDKMIEWFKSKTQSKIDQKKNNVNRFKGYDKKLKIVRIKNGLR